MKPRQMQWGQNGVGVDSKWGSLMSLNSPPQQAPLIARSSQGRRRASQAKALTVALRHGL